MNNASATLRSLTPPEGQNEAYDLGYIPVTGDHLQMETTPNPLEMFFPSVEGGPPHAISGYPLSSRFLSVDLIPVLRAYKDSTTFCPESPIFQMKLPP